MKKNFITVTPDSGTSGSSNTISVAAEPNILLKERSEILNFNASGGVSKSVQVIQNSMPYFPIRFPFVLNMNKFIGNLKVDSSGVLQGAYSISEIKSIDPSAYDSSLGVGWGMGSTQKMLIYDPFSNVTEIVAHIIDSSGTYDANFISSNANMGRIWGDPGLLYQKLLKIISEDYTKGGYEIRINSVLAMKFVFVE